MLSETARTNLNNAAALYGYLSRGYPKPNNNYTLDTTTGRAYRDAQPPPYGLAAYIAAVTAANPYLDNYSDTRPEYLKDQDSVRSAPYAARLELASSGEYNRRGPLPTATSKRSKPLRLLWSNVYAPRTTTTSKALLNTLLARDPENGAYALLVAISLHFHITPQAGALTPHARVCAVLEALGNGYLTPENRPARHPQPATPKPRSASRRNYGFALL